MALFALGDTHLSLTADKYMDKFPGWENYVSRMENSWRQIVSDDDTIVLCGDISWAMHLDDSLRDLEFINSLPGRKILVKGNHDYWWITKTKTERFLAEHSLSTIDLLFNNSYSYGDYSICGTRGWSYDCPQNEYNVLLRECGRLRLSIDSAKESGREPIVFMHYPPVYGDYRCNEIMDVLHEYSIKRCYYGHLHGASHRNAVIGDCEGIDMRLISADYCRFTPVLCER